MTRNLTLALLPVVGPDTLVGRFAVLPTFLFGTDFDAATGQLPVQVGDELTIRVVAFEVGAPRRAVAIHRLNVVAWPAPATDCPVFATCFQVDPDRPDATILAAGHARFAPAAWEPPPIDGVYPPAAGPFPPEGGEQTAFLMVFPTRIGFTKPGRFSVAISLTLRLGEGAEAVLQTFRTDPEMNVEGSYPPAPEPSNGSSTRW